MTRADQTKQTNPKLMETLLALVIGIDMMSPQLSGQRSTTVCPLYLTKSHPQRRQKEHQINSKTIQHKKNDI